MFEKRERNPFAPLSNESDFLSSELFVMSTKSTKGKQNKTTKEKSAIKKKRSSLQKEQEKK
nr:MAG TPA: hypothetical protein [Caudoviricetes sp.]